MSESIIKITDLSFAYQGDKVLDEINLEIEQGDFVGLIGPNGSGKTTLVKIILGILKPQNGQVSLFGKTLSHFIDWDKIGYVPQRATLAGTHFPISVNEVVGMSGGSKTEIKSALKAVEMQDFSNRLITELSGGQQQRVFIARALVTKPKLLILDEPTVGVDFESQTKFYQLLKKLNQEEKLTLILVSHDVDVVGKEVTTVLCINKKIVCHGSPKEVLTSKNLDKLHGEFLKHVEHGH